jgi:hypothetical protein
MAMVKRAERLAELQAMIESAKAEIKQIQADEQAEKAETEKGKAMNFKAAASSDRGLSGNRDADGNFVTENTSGKPMDLKPDLGEDGVSTATRKRTAEEEEIYKALMEGKELTDEQYEITNQMSIEDFEATGIPLVGQKIFTEGEEEMVDEKQIAEPQDLMKGMPPEEISEGEPKYMGTDPDEERAFAENVEPSKKSNGFKADDGGNMSVDEKDDFWKTQEGYNKAMEMYGSKPAWVPDEPTMVFNPTTQEYEEIKDEDKEEFEDLSTPSMSADIKALFG